MNPASPTPNAGPLLWYSATPQQWPAQQYVPYASSNAWVPAASAAPNAPDVGRVDPSAVEREAAAGFIHQAASSAIQQVFRYLEDHSEKHPRLAEILPLMSQAVDAFRAHDDTRAFDLAFQVYRAITLLRATGPELPPLDSSRP